MKGDSGVSPKRSVENAIETKHPATVQELAQILVAGGILGEEDFVRAVKEMAADGSLILQEPVHEVESPWDYLLTPSLSAWLWATLGTTILAVTAVLLTPDIFPVVVIRWLLGSILVLFLPGYALVQFLFPKASEMDSLERFALEIGLSLALVPLMGLVLNYTPWGIRFIPATMSLSAFTIIFLLAAATREYLYVQERSPTH